MPIEIVEIGTIPRELMDQALALANTIQSEFTFQRLPGDEAKRLAMHEFERVKASEFMDTMDDVRKDARGYHPYLLAFIDGELDGDDYTNIFGSNRPEKGLGVLTIANVPGVIIPPERLAAYFLYYLARYTMSFIVPAHKNHDDTRSCVYDRKVQKRDLLKSMKARSICDDCRRALLAGDSQLSSAQLLALSKMFDMSGKLLASPEPKDDVSRKLPRTFIGSSTEGLPIANKLQALLEYDVNAEIWNQGTVFGLGDGTLEALEQAVLTYEFGIFVFTPDDQLHVRNELKPVARDNVIFELGLFIGRLGRKRVFVVHPSRKTISLPSDLAGITTAAYDAEKPNLIAALGPACEKLRAAVARILT